jgi:flagellar capping protein FliD
MPVSSAQSGLAIEYYARISADQENIKRQADRLTNAAQKVNSQLTTFDPVGLFEIMYESDKTSTAFQSFAVSSLRQLVKSYNKLNDSLAASDRITNEGAGLLEKVKKLLTGPNAEKYNNIGMSLDRYTGAIQFDEQKFTAAITSDPTSVRNLLMDNKQFGPVLQNVIDTIALKPTTFYFNSSFSIRV